MHIVYIGLSYYPPQIGKTDILKISHEASKRGHTVTVFVKRKKGEKRVEKIGNKMIYRLPSFGVNSIVDECIFISLIPYMLLRNCIRTDIFHIYNPFFLVSILHILLRIVSPASEIIFDIRTGPLKEGFKKTLNYFLITLGHITAHKTILIHTNLLKNFFYVKGGSIHEVALGFDPMPQKHTTHSKSQGKKYIYIGSIYPRRELENMLLAFEQYLKLYPYDMVTILGGGDTSYERKLRAQFESDRIVFLGAVDHEEVSLFVAESDYGVAYIPMRSYFMDQPPLKTIEYLGSGLPVIGTQTHGNQLFVTDTNGVLALDSPDPFFEGLGVFREKFSEYSSGIIQGSVAKYEWSNIYDTLMEKIYRNVSTTEKDLKKNQIDLH